MIGEDECAGRVHGPRGSRSGRENPGLLSLELSFCQDTLFLERRQILELLHAVLASRGRRGRRRLFVGRLLLLFLLRPAVLLATGHATGDGRRRAGNDRCSRTHSE